MVSGPPRGAFPRVSKIRARFWLKETRSKAGSRPRPVFLHSEHRTHHRKARRARIDFTFDLDPAALRTKLPVPADELISPTVVALQYPDATLEISQRDGPSQLHRRISFFSNARAMKRQITALATSHGSARKWKGRKARPGARDHAA